MMYQTEVSLVNIYTLNILWDCLTDFNNCIKQFVEIIFTGQIETVKEPHKNTKQTNNIV